MLLSAAGLLNKVIGGEWYKLFPSGSSASDFFFFFFWLLMSDLRGFYTPSNFICRAAVATTVLANPLQILT